MGWDGEDAESTRMEKVVNERLAGLSGMSFQQVEHLRREFKKFGTRHPPESTLEILALENGLDERRVKLLYNFHARHLKHLDQFSEQIKVVDGYDF